MNIELSDWEIRVLRQGLKLSRRKAIKNKEKTPDFIPEEGRLNIHDEIKKTADVLLKRLPFPKLPGLRYPTEQCSG